MWLVQVKRQGQIMTKHQGRIMTKHQGHIMTKHQEPRELILTEPIKVQDEGRDIMKWKRTIGE